MFFNFYVVNLNQEKWAQQIFFEKWLKTNILKDKKILISLHKKEKKENVIQRSKFLAIDFIPS